MTARLHARFIRDELSPGCPGSREPSRARVSERVSENGRPAGQRRGLSVVRWMDGLLHSYLNPIFFSIVYSIKGILPFSPPSQPAIRPAIQLSSYPVSQ